MTEWLPTEYDVDTRSIIRFDGNPNEPSRANEATLWKRFLKVIWPFAKTGGEWARYSGELGKTFAEAEVAQRVNTAERIAAEAAETAARADINRQDAVRIFSEQIDAIFSGDNVPESAKMLKLAKLLAANPDLTCQVNKVSKLIETLAKTRGTRIEIVPAVESTPKAPKGPRAENVRPA